MEPFIATAMKLARSWVDSAGLTIEWIDRPEAMSQALIEPNAGRRAHWRCAVELVRLCAELSWEEASELLRSSAHEPNRVVDARHESQFDGLTTKLLRRLPAEAWARQDYPGMEAQQFVEALVKSGLTQSQIAERTGIPQPTLSKVLRGDVADVLSRNYRKLQALYEEVVAQKPPTDRASATEAEA